MLIGRGNLICLLKNGSVANESKNRTVASLYAEVRTFGGDTGAETARRFIYYFGADEAVKMIDWAAIGKQNPFTDKG